MQLRLPYARFLASFRSTVILAALVSLAACASPGASAPSDPTTDPTDPTFEASQPAATSSVEASASASEAATGACLDAELYDMLIDQESRIEDASDEVRAEVADAIEALDTSGMSAEEQELVQRLAAGVREAAVLEVSRLQVQAGEIPIESC